MSKFRQRSSAGASLTEAVVGLVVLVPVVLALIDITAIVIAQTSNDALAKHAARQAAGQVAPSATMNQAQATALRQQAAQAVVTGYGSNSLCSAPQMVNYSEPNAGQAVSQQVVTVTTQIVCNLPVPVPMGGPATWTFKAQATEPVIGTRALIADPTGNNPINTGSGGTADTTYLILSSPLPTGLGGAAAQNPAALQLPQGAITAAPSNGPTTGSNTGAGGDGGGGAGDGGGGAGDGGGGAGDGGGGGGDGGGGDGGDGG